MSIILSTRVIIVVVLCIMFSIGITMLAAQLVLKNGLDDIDVTNLLMVEVCVFATVMCAVLLILEG